jgi:hypothetical protein
MFNIIKGKQQMTVDSRHGLRIYLANGWSLVGETVAEETQPNEPTKKELQEQLEARGIEYSPRDNKTTLQAKLEGSQPTDNFDDGLLKG